MNEQRLDFTATLASLPPIPACGEAQKLGLSQTIIVLDDDPTGIQTVNGVSVYTDWSEETFCSAFASGEHMFFVLTNSRGLSSAASHAQHEAIAQHIAAAAKATGTDFILISRGDSTLRGHYPMETDTVRSVLETELGICFDGEIICPFFCEGGRYTLNNVHYVKEGDELVPAGQTEFAKDKTFGYTSSDLCEWVEEKTQGKYTASGVVSIPLDLLRAGDIAAVTDLLAGASGFSKIILNAADYGDIRVFALAFREALKQGKRFIFRSAAAIPKVLGDVADKPLLGKKELVDADCSAGGLIVVGSHVNKTTSQFAELMKLPGIQGIEFNQHRVLEEGGLEDESRRVSALAEKNIEDGITTVVYTRRERIDIPNASPEEQLRAAVHISDSVTAIVTNLKTKPAFIIAKGGITSSDIGTTALRVKKALVLGQVAPGIPVWLTGEESKFPGMPYIIFPGNVGSVDTLANIVAMLTAE